MKRIHKIALGIFLLLVILAASCIIYLQQLKPKFSGELVLTGLHQPVEIIFDHYGVPHIYGQNEEDAYFALGYVHAQERLFQMEIIRRIGAGRLAEIFGEELVKTDKFFRTIGIAQTAARNAERYFTDPSTSFQRRPWPISRVSISIWQREKHRLNSGYWAYPKKNLHPEISI